jgi:hypothetical protein
MSSSRPIVEITISISTKLDHTNFLTWKSQIKPIVHEYGLFGSFLAILLRHLNSQELILADKNQSNPMFLT